MAPGANLISTTDFSPVVIKAPSENTFAFFNWSIITPSTWPWSVMCGWLMWVQEFLDKLPTFIPSSLWDDDQHKNLFQGLRSKQRYNSADYYDLLLGPKGISLILHISINLSFKSAYIWSLYPCVLFRNVEDNLSSLYDEVPSHGSLCKQTMWP